MMDTIKPELERVKNLLLDTVTLLCKNSLQYENYLRVEGLLGVAVDGKDTFFLHISEGFQSEAYIERLNHEREEKEAEANRKEQQEKEAAEQEELKAEASRNAAESLAVQVKTESQEQGGDDSDNDLVITGSSILHSPQSVAQAATVVAGQRRSMRRPHSPSVNSHNQTDSSVYHNQQNSPFVQTDSGDGEGSFSHYDGNQSIKEEGWGDGPPPAKRQSVSNPWPNVTSMGDISLQAAQASFQDADGSFGGGSGDLSQPGCSAWPTNLPGSQDSSDSGDDSGGDDTDTDGDDIDDDDDDDREPSLWQVTIGEVTSKLKRTRTLPKRARVHPTRVLPPPPPSSSRTTGTPAKTYDCEICKRMFKRSDHLRDHLNTHTGEKPYKCQFCDYAAKKRSNFTGHLKKKHPLLA